MSKVTKKSIQKNIKKLLISGATYLEIANKYGVSKTSIGDISQKFGIDTRTLRREKRFEKLKEIKKNARKLLKSGYSIIYVRKKLGITSEQLKILKNMGVNLYLVDKEGISKRRKIVDKLYKSGKTAYEIIPEFKEYRIPSDVYRDVCILNNGHLPKRKNNYVKKSEALTKEIAKLYKKHTLVEVCEILNSNGLTNAYGGKVKATMVASRIYNKLKK